MIEVRDLEPADAVSCDEIILGLPYHFAIEAGREECARAVRNEPGCLSHAVHVDCENPLRLVFVEEWESREALLTHFAVPESRAFVKSARALAVEASPIAIFDANRIDKL